MISSYIFTYVCKYVYHSKPVPNHLLSSLYDMAHTHFVERLQGSHGTCRFTRKSCKFYSLLGIEKDPILNFLAHKNSWTISVTKGKVSSIEAWYNLQDIPVKPPVDPFNRSTKCLYDELYMEIFIKVYSSQHLRKALHSIPSSILNDTDMHSYVLCIFFKQILRVAIVTCTMLFFFFNS